MEDINKNESKRKIQKQSSGGLYKQQGSMSLLEYQKQKWNQENYSNIQHIQRKQVKKTKSNIEIMK